jgi:hypothetical protein
MPQVVEPKLLGQASSCHGGLEWHRDSRFRAHASVALCVALSRKHERIAVTAQHHLAEHRQQRVEDRHVARLARLRGALPAAMDRDETALDRDVGIVQVQDLV